MPLNLGGDNDFTPYLKYNAKAGRFYARPQGSSEDVEIDKPRIAVDMQNIRTGWIYFPEGAPPEKVWDASLTQPAPRPNNPGKKFRRGFEVMVYLADNVPGFGVPGLREWMSSAANTNEAIVKMYNDYESQSAANVGKVPFFKCTGVKPINGAYGTNYEPQFVIAAWIDRTKVPAFDEAAEKRETKSVAVPTGGPIGPEPPPLVAPPRNPLDDDIPFMMDR